ncbi:peptidase s9 prolyl oligopeptidase active site domain protein [Moniliophthora roreri]|uniref:Dipeptidyl-peptidase V n=1 Tax=Moniliophthora roreri TaxID=221103 RepID=A0A0W0EZJ6_MONRR|nr:peptidase s9 prolyl oligopeptidase active site domain protein [Moniliophthora roreri]
MVTAHDYAEAERIASVRISLDGSRVVYTCGPRYTKKTAISSVWIANISRAGSATKLTTGDHYDFSPVFNPLSSNEIYFLSNRHGASHLFKLILNNGNQMEGEPRRVFEFDGPYTVTSFSISPDGCTLAFVYRSDRDRGESKPKVWRKMENPGMLGLVDLKDDSRTVRQLVAHAAMHVESFIWTPDSSAIIYRVCQNNDMESQHATMMEHMISIVTGHIESTNYYPRLPGDVVCKSNRQLFIIQPRTPEQLMETGALWARRMGDEMHHLGYGDDDQPFSITDLGSSTSQFAISIGRGVNSSIDVFNLSTRMFTAYQTKDEKEAILDKVWDMKFSTDGLYILVLVLSSIVTGEPPNVWAVTLDSTGKQLQKVKLSSHYAWLRPEDIPIGQVVTWESSDGTQLQGMIHYPRGMIESELKSLPTVMVPHGGPEIRDVPEITFDALYWKILLASKGYLVLSPNYRGSSGRGEAFAKQGVPCGNLDWDDVESMITNCIQRGIVNPGRLAIAGYSQGGFMAAFACSRPHPKFAFKAVIIGAGVTDGGALAASSDIPDAQAFLSNSYPWAPGNYVDYFRASAIKDACHVRAPVLFVHGEQDERIPLAQAIGFYRGIERVAHTTPKPILVVYPEEGHFFRKAANVEDMLNRIVQFLDRYMK